MHLPENAMGTSAFVVVVCKMEKMKMHDVVVCVLCVAEGNLLLTEYCGVFVHLRSGKKFSNM